MTSCRLQHLSVLCATGLSLAALAGCSGNGTVGAASTAGSTAASCRYSAAQAESRTTLAATASTTASTATSTATSATTSTATSAERTATTSATATATASAGRTTTGAPTATATSGATGRATNTTTADVLAERTTVAVISPDFTGSTANADEERPALSVAKLFLVNYALVHGDGSDKDLDLSERAIRASDDSAADALFAKYPEGITETAEEYDLDDTVSGIDWGWSTTTASDVATFLSELLEEDDSPILEWMENAARVAADGTRQNWGTGTLPFMSGTKWGWSSSGTPAVASASFSRSGLVMVAFTYGTGTDQTADVRSFAASLPALPELC
ncbi:serine hydrolase [Corynebacterium terpenotabidum]|uniref:Lipoprotein n=1 Tax=Corynebacterium terpenotabidum Y-11 TaxID=1200352 RepID=S4XCB4_9CORY|nr:hypothetical protein [Corynebacterium terpenotabidum]AGP30236.1 hypothetical protein A606_02915 [Corynebacterium terpenotabidum Y-11]